MAWTLTTKAKVAALITVDTTSLKDEWSSWIERLIKNYRGFEYVGATATITDERHDGDGTPVLFVTYPPIVSVTSVSVGTTNPSDLADTDYKVYDRYIELVHTEGSDLAMALKSVGTVFPIGQQNVTITYVSGESSVPADVEMAATLMIAEIVQYYKRGGVQHSLKYATPEDEEGTPTPIHTNAALVSTVMAIMHKMLPKKVIPLG